MLNTIVAIVVSMFNKHTYDSVARALLCATDEAVDQPMLGVAAQTDLRAAPDLDTPGTGGRTIHSSSTYWAGSNVRQ